MKIVADMGLETVSVPVLNGTRTYIATVAVVDAFVFGGNEADLERDSVAYLVEYEGQEPILYVSHPKE